MDIKSEGKAIQRLTDDDLVGTTYAYRKVFLGRQKQYHRALDMYSGLIAELEKRGLMDAYRAKIRH